MTPIYIPVLAVDAAGARVGDTHVSGTTATVIDIEHHRSDLAAALRQGSVVVAGAVSSSATGIVVTSGATVTPTPGEPLHVDVAAGSLYDRAEATTQSIAAKTKLALKAVDKHKDRTSLVIVKASTGVASIVDGTLAEPGLSVAPAAGSGNIGIATVLVKQGFPKQLNTFVITDVRPRP